MHWRLAFSILPMLFLTCQAHSEGFPQPYYGEIHCYAADDNENDIYQARPSLRCRFEAEPDAAAQNEKAGPESNAGYVSALLAWIRRLFGKTISDPIALFTLVLMISTILLWRETRRTANIARRAAETGETALIIPQRAYVFHDQINMSAVCAADGSVLAWVVIPGWKNFGTTPARQAVCHTSLYCQRGMGALSDAFGFPEQWDIGEPAVAMVSIPPMGAIGDSAKRIPIGALMGAAQKKQKIFMYGWIEYDDAFSGTSRHRTEFCVEVIVRADPRVDVGALPSDSRPQLFLFNFHGRHNGAEQECQTKPAPPERRLSELRESRRQALTPKAGDIVRPEDDEFIPPNGG